MCYHIYIIDLTDFIYRSLKGIGKMRKYLLMTAAAFLPTPLAADSVELSPYFGVSVSADHIRFNKNVTGVANIAKWNAVEDIHAGIDLNDAFGFEFGYYQNNSRTKNTALSSTASQVFLGRNTIIAVNPILGDNGDIHRITFKNSAIRLNFTAQQSICDTCDLKAIGMVGLAWEKNRLIDTKFSDNNLAQDNPDKKTLYSQRRALATLSAGIKWQFSSSSGLRALATWQNRARLPALVGKDIAQNRQEALLQNSLRYSLGIYSYI